MTATAPPGPLAPPGEPARAWWGDRSVRTKILAAVATSAAVTAVVAAMGIGSLTEAAEKAHSMYAVNLRGVEAAADMDALLNEMRVGARDAVVAADLRAGVGRFSF
ncbi:MCP four helix bundle domain-containing protein [Geodermatophilus sp. SYSU D00708]